MTTTIYNIFYMDKKKNSDVNANEALPLLYYLLIVYILKKYNFIFRIYGLNIHPISLLRVFYGNPSQIHKSLLHCKAHSETRHQVML